MRRAFTLLLPLLAIALTGCPPPSASALLSPETPPPSEHRATWAERGREAYLIRTYYTADSLNARLALPTVGYTTIRLLDGTTIRTEAVQVDGESLAYRIDGADHRVPLFQVNRLRVRDRLSASDLRSELGWTVPFYGAIGGAGQVRQGVKEVVVGTVVGATVGAIIGYGQANAMRGEETIVLNGYDFTRY